jgi:hypothetical protein
MESYMGIANYIRKNFLGKEICIFLGDDAETINYDQASPVNWAYYRGTVEDVDVEDGVIVLNIPDVGRMYVDSTYSLKAFWEPSFDLYRAMSTSITKKMIGPNKQRA